MWLPMGVHFTRRWGLTFLLRPQLQKAGCCGADRGELATALLSHPHTWTVDRDRAPGLLKMPPPPCAEDAPRPLGILRNGSPDAPETQAISRHLRWLAQLPQPKEGTFSLMSVLFPREHGSAAGRERGASGPGLASPFPCVPRGCLPAPRQAACSPSQWAEKAVNTMGQLGLQWRVREKYLPFCPPLPARRTSGR